MQFILDLLARLGLIAGGRADLAAGRVHAAQWLFAPAGQTLLIGGAIGAAALSIMCYVKTREGLSLPSRIIMVLARFTSLGVLLIMASGLVCAVNVTRPRNPQLLVVIDDSPSMSLPASGGGGGESRLARVQNALWQRGLLNRLHESFDIRLASTSGAPVAPNSDTAMAPQDLGKALIKQAVQHTDRPIDHVLLISDGAQTGDHDLAAAAPEIPAPVSTLCVSDEADIHDVSLRDATVPPFAYLHDHALIGVQLQSLGIDREVTLKLFHVTDAGEKVAGTSTVKVSAAEQDAVARIEFETKAPGMQHYILRMDPVEGELTAANNSIDFNLDVRSEKVRVLFVEGEPSWEYKFAKQALESDPVVSFHGLVRLPGEEWFYQGDAARADGKPVIARPKDGFPASSAELEYFDILILGDLERKIFEQNNRFDAVDGFVRRHGGGLVTIGGFKVYAAGNYDDTPLARLIPLSVTREKKTQLVNRFNVEATTQGIMHPAMQLESDPVKNADAWSKLPWVEGGNAFKSVKPGATTLMVHPTLKTSLGPRPIAAAWQCGQGRVFSTALDGTWHWRLAGKSDTDYHKRYWGQVARWTAGDPRLSQRISTIICDDAVLEAFKPVRLSVHIKDKDGNPDATAAVTFEVNPPPGVGSRISGQSQSDLALPGRYAFSFLPMSAGIHQVKAVVTIAGEAPRTLEIAPFVGAARSEFLQVKPDPQALAELAKAAGGVSGSLARADAFKLPDIAAQPYVTQVVIDLWRAPGLLFVLIGALTSEWLMRKRRGLA